MPVLSTVAAACARAWGFTAGDLFAGAALALDFDETTTLDSRITFTRATNGTYFDSSGVLQTASSGVARFDHRLESGVWVNKGLLIEEQRTNIFQRSEEIGDAYYSQVNITVTNNDTTAPDGTTTAEKVLETTANDEHYLYRRNSSFDMTSTNYAFSFFVKANGRTRGRIQAIYIDGSPFDTIYADFNLSDKTITAANQTGSAVALNSSIQECNNSWFRITISGRTGRNGNNDFRLLFFNDSGQGTYTGDVTKGMYVWGMQLEAGAFPTSYIKTTTASVTRNQDVAQMSSTNFSSWFNATEGTAFVQVDSVNNPVVTNAANTGYNISDGSTNERYQMFYGVVSGNFTGRYLVVDGNANQASLDNTLTFVANQTYKSASAYKVNDFASTTNGASVVTDTSGTLPTVNLLTFGGISTLNNTSVVSPTNGHIAKFYYWNTRKSNNFLTSITS